MFPSGENTTVVLNIQNYVYEESQFSVLSLAQWPLLKYADLCSFRIPCNFCSGDIHSDYVMMFNFPYRTWKKYVRTDGWMDACIHRCMHGWIHARTIYLF